MLAYAAHCQADTQGRPLAGTVVICREQLRQERYRHDTTVQVIWQQRCVGTHCVSTFFFLLWSLWQPLELYGKTSLWLGTVPWFFPPNVMSVPLVHIGLFFLNVWTKIGTDDVQTKISIEISGEAGKQEVRSYLSNALMSQNQTWYSGTHFEEAQNMLCHFPTRGRCNKQKCVLSNNCWCVCYKTITLMSSNTVGGPKAETWQLFLST